MTKLRDISSEKGKPLRLEVTFAGTPVVNVSWKKDGNPILASHQYTVISSDTSCILDVLNSDTTEAAGRYCCEVDNGAGSDRCEAQVLLLGNRHMYTLLNAIQPFHFDSDSMTSSSFTLERPYFVEKMQLVEVIVGDPLTLRCCIGGAANAVTWFKAGEQLRRSNTCSVDYVDGVATLKLMKTSTFDCGEYTCRAENRLGWASTSCDVIVKGDCLHVSH